MDTTTLTAFVIGFTIGAGGMVSLMVFGFVCRQFAAHAEAQNLIYNFADSLKEAAKEEVHEVKLDTPANKSKPKPQKKYVRRKAKKS